ncbi:MAG: hypothetical protein LC802_09225 [Acidobacteria bacterium]|nr:hypothetical protein [Acidobacteriota bacterium]
MRNQTRKLIRRRPRNGRSAPVIASKNCNVRLFEEDLDEVLRMVSAKGSNESEIVRSIVNDWMRLKKKQVVATEATAIPERLRDLITETLEQHLRPLRDKQASMGDGIAELLATLDEVKVNIHGKTTGGSGDSHPPLLDELKSLLRRLETELVATRQYVAAERAESGERVSKQTRQMARLLQRSRAEYTLLGQSFMCGWTTLEFVVRFLVEARLRLDGLEPEEIASKATDERNRLRERANEMIVTLEEGLKLPEEIRLELVHNLLP